MSDGLFERRFRSHFVPDGDGYLYYVREGAVRFEPAEVEALVAERRRIAGNPLVWGAWIVLGLALPFWMIRQGGDIEAFGIALAVVANVAMLVSLVHADSLADKAAQTRMLEKLDGVPRPSLFQHLLWVGLVGIYIWRGVSDSRADPAFAVFNGALALLFAGLILWSSYRFWRDWQRWQAQLSGR